MYIALSNAELARTIFRADQQKDVLRTTREEKLPSQANTVNWLANTVEHVVCQVTFAPHYPLPVDGVSVADPCSVERWFKLASTSEDSDAKIGSAEISFNAVGG